MQNYDGPADNAGLHSSIACLKTLKHYHCSRHGDQFEVACTYVFQLNSVSLDCKKKDLIFPCKKLNFEQKVH